MNLSLLTSILTITLRAGTSLLYATVGEIYAERSGILALRVMLREVDPHHERLGLKQVPTFTGDYLWLCQKHYEAMQPKIPEKI